MLQGLEKKMIHQREEGVRPLGFEEEGEEDAVQALVACLHANETLDKAMAKVEEEGRKGDGGASKINGEDDGGV